MKPDTDVVGEVALVNATTAGFAAAAVHVPVPVAANEVVLYWQIV